MDLRKLKTLIDLVSESGVAELEITEGEDRVRIVNRNGAAPVQVHQPVTVAQPMPVPVPAPEVAPAPAPTPPQPGADPFVKVGDTVKKGQVVCIIEAMKLLNEVEADMDGTVKEVCVENGQPVEFGQSLFIIE